MNKLVSLGELLIDFAAVGEGGLKGAAEFKKNAGGAPANVCAQAVKLGCRAVYLTQVGQDGFGEFLIDSLREVGIDTRYIKTTPLYDTSLAFVSFKKGGEREFTFYRRTAADLYFTPADFEKVEFEKGDIFEFGSVALKTCEAQKTHDYIIDKAKKAGALIAFDPNLRFNLWESRDELKKTVLKYAKRADIIKISDDELQFITDETGERAGAQKLLERGARIVLVTRGGDGASAYLADGAEYDCAGFKVKSVDTTGAGDSFFGGFLACLLKDGCGLEKLTAANRDIEKYLEFSCKCGAYTTTGYGAIAAMACEQQLKKMGE